MLIRITSLFLLLTCYQFCLAQADEIKQPHWNRYFSFGAGPSYLSNFNAEVYQDGHSNVQLGLLFERSVHPRLSLLAGVELERMVYAFDGILLTDANDQTQIEVAPGDIKYTTIVRNNLALPLQLRYYFQPNNRPEDTGVYVQGGIRVALNGSSDFTYRQGGEAQSDDISGLTQQRTLSGEFMLGFKGNFFERIDLLNASSFGIIYQFTPVFAVSTTNAIRPIHVTWRFLF